MRGARNKQTLKSCEYDYASFFKGVTTKHSLLARCKFATSSVYDKQTSNGPIVAEMRPMTPKHRLLWSKLKKTPIQVRVWEALETNKTWTLPNMAMPRSSRGVWPQNIHFWQGANSLHEGRSKQTKHWNHANMTMPRSLSVWPQNIRFCEVQIRYIQCLRQTNK